MLKRAANALGSPGVIGPSSAYSTLPSALGNEGPAHRAVLTLSGGPGRLTDVGGQNNLAARLT